MSNQDRDEYAARVRKVLVRWCIVLAALAAFAVWSTWRMRAAASKMSQLASAAQTSAAEAGVRPAEAGEAERGKLWYMCTMPECGDVGSHDPDSRCPVCGIEYAYRKTWVKQTGDIVPREETLGCRRSHEWQRGVDWPSDPQIMEMAGVLHEEVCGDG